MTLTILLTYILVFIFYYNQQVKCTAITCGRGLTASQV